MFSRSNAQVKADFTSASQAGCAPLVIQFKDASTGSPVKWKWDLGNGTISTQQNPACIYLNPGTYTVTLTATDASGNSSSIVKKNYITVYSNPVPDFSFTPDAGCAPINVQLTDKSNPGSGTLANWQWDFGDGQFGSGQNPAHTYKDAADFSIVLTVTNSFGCSTVLQKNKIISVQPSVKADFGYSYTSACAPPTDVTFDNNSSSTAASLNYQWTFGDGGSTTNANPVYTYNSNGKFNVTLIASNSGGCADTVTKQLTIGTVLPAFTMSASTCTNKQITFNDSSLPVPQLATWDFGDGSSKVYGESVTHAYKKSGAYTVLLTTDFGGSCSSTITKTIQVSDQPTAAFASSGNISQCSLPSAVNFQNQSGNGAVSYQWDFGDGSTSTTANPLHNYTKAGFFNVTLIAANVLGCTDTLVSKSYIKLGPPIIDSFLKMPFNGCVPSTVNFAAAIRSSEPITTYLWDFGDGNTSSLATPSNTYTNIGVYNVKLVVATATAGCSDSLLVPAAVHVGNKPTAKFDATPTDICASTPVQFTDQSTGNVTGYQWDFGDNTKSGVQNPLHTFKDTGYFSVRLVVSSNGCPDTLSANQMIHVKQGIANFSTKLICSKPFDRTFIDSSLGAQTWDWNFGDGSAHSSQKNPVHTYATSGKFYINLTVTGECTSTKKDSILILDQFPTISLKPNKTILCRNDTLRYTAVNYNSAQIKQFAWNFGDGASTALGKNNYATHKYSTVGQFLPQLIFTDINNCKDTVSYAQKIDVHGPTAAFTNDSGACLNGKINFVDQSKDVGHTVSQWIWTFGDGTTQTITAPPFAHQYNKSGTFDIKLKIVDETGCVDSVKKTAAVLITNPKAGFAISTPTRCLVSPVSFIDSSKGINLKYQWNFGDASSSSNTSMQQNPQHKYSQYGSYMPTLTITDRFGCTSTVQPPDSIHIADAHASFQIADTIGACPPLKISPVNTSQNYSTLLWNFDDGNTSSLQAPIHTYTQGGNFKLMLIAYGFGNCKDTATQIIHLKGPSGSFTYTPLTGCEPLQINFQATAQHAAAYVWDFADGTTETTVGAVDAHTYTAAGSFLPKVILVDSSGCQVPLINQADTIKPIQTNAVFNYTFGNSCDSTLLQFVNNSDVTNDVIKKYSWDFGDGTNTSTVNPLHYYKTSGTYNVKLVSTTANGCTDSLITPINVTVNPVPVVQTIIPAMLCAKGIGSFSAMDKTVNDSAVTWVWMFGNGDTLHNATASYAYPLDGSFNVSVIATNGFACADTLQQAITINPLPLVDAGNDTTICLNQSITLQPTGAVNYSWAANATLNCTNCSNPIATPVNKEMYYVTGTNQFGCTAIDSISVDVKHPLTLSVQTLDTLCLGQSIQLEASGEELYEWSPPNGLSNTSIANPVASPTVTTTYTLTGSDSKKCFIDSAHVTIMVVPQPTFSIVDSAAKIQVGTNYNIITTSSSDVTIWSWQPPVGLSCINCANPVASPRQTTQYIGTAKNQYGCSATDEITINVFCNDKNFFIPNTFSPNGDGMNDWFYPRGNGLYRIKAFRVFNRWGQVVFQKMNMMPEVATEGWNGKLNGQDQPSDVYVYVIEMVCDNGTTLSQKGNVTLIR
jgi:gliding motility-associated-like protein